MTTHRIPFNRAAFLGQEAEYAVQAFQSGHISGDGGFTRKCHAWLKRELGADALLTTSCTHALEMSALLLDIQPGDEVIIPSFTFVSTVNAFVLRGARPVFIDIRSDTFNLNEALLDAQVTPRTKAIIVVHYAGVGCEMDSVMDIARRRDIPVVEDNAHGLFGKYKGKYLGTFGVLAAQSFHETKNFSCGEGGALVINEPKFTERAEIIREKGTDRSRFFRGQVDKYSWMDLGSSYLPSDILAAVLYAQLERRDYIQARRRFLWNQYHSRLADWAAAGGSRLPVVPDHCEPAWHMFQLLMPSLESRQALIAHLASRGITGVFHYLPLHLSTAGRRFGGWSADCPVCENISDRIVRLPFYTSMTESEQAEVVEAVLAFRG